MGTLAPTASRLLASGALAGVVACNALLGIESASFEPRADELDGSVPDDDDVRPRPDASMPEPDSGPCTDLDKNPRHCGACFHDCLGGECVDRVCKPYVVTKDPGATIFALALGGGSVFYTESNSGETRRAPLTGGPPSLFRKAGSSSGGRIVVHDGHLYFRVAATLVKCPLEDCTTTTEVARAGVIAAFAIDEDGTVVIAEAGADTRVLRCAKPPCTNSSGYDVIATAEDSPANIAVNGPNVAWTIFGTGGAGTALRIGSAGAEPRTLVSAGALLFVALTPDRVVFGNPDQAIRVLSHAGTNGKTLANVLHATEFLAVDGDTLYYADAHNNAVMRTPLDGSSPPTPIATAQAGPRAIAVDEHAITWVTTENSTIWRLAK